MIWVISLSGFVVFQFILLRVCITFFWKDHSESTTEEDFPFISVLIPARDEEEVLPRLLASLELIDYPEEKLEIILADDQSEDNSPKLMQTWCEKATNRHYMRLDPVTYPKVHVNGKASALFHLSKKAKGKYLFLTDADCLINPSWVKSGVSSISEKGGMLLGVTQVVGEGWLATMQEVDWWYTLGVVKVSNDLGFGTTGLGNNMVISRKELEEIGGFEALPDSLTEDLALCRAFLKNGSSVYQQVSQGMLLQTKAEQNWEDFLRQRKRWISGVLTLPFYWLLFLGLQFAFFPLVFVLIFLNPIIGIMLWVGKVFFQTLFIAYFAKKAEIRVPLGNLIVFDFYQILSVTLSILSYIWSREITWKKRSYR